MGSLKKHTGTFTESMPNVYIYICTHERVRKFCRCVPMRYLYARLFLSVFKTAANAWLELKLLSFAGRGGAHAIAAITPGWAHTALETASCSLC